MEAVCSGGGTIVKLKASNIHMQLKIHMSYGCVEIGSNISRRLFEMNHIRIVWIIQITPQFGYIAIPWGCRRNSTQAKSISPAKLWTLCCGCCCCCCYELRVSLSFSPSSSVSLHPSFLFFFSCCRPIFLATTHHSPVHKSIFSICFYSNIFALFDFRTGKHYGLFE